MIDEIIKEVQNKSFIPDSYCEEHISLEDLFEILDKYNNQPDYKTISQIAKMISSGEIPKEVYDKYLGDCPIGFMNYGDLLKYLTNNQPDYKSDIELFNLANKTLKDENNTLNKGIDKLLMKYEDKLNIVNEEIKLLSKYEKATNEILQKNVLSYLLNDMVYNLKKLKGEYNEQFQ